MSRRPSIVVGLRLGVAVMAVLVLASGCYSFTWDQFGGSSSHSGQAVQETHLTYPSLGSIGLSLDVALPGAVDSSAVVLSGKSTYRGTRDLALVTTKDAKLAAVDINDGSVVWVDDFGNPGCTFNNNGLFPCWTTAGPAGDPVTGQFAFTYGLDGAVHKVALYDGSEVFDGLFPLTVTTKPWDEKGSSNLSTATARDGTHYLYAVLAGYPGNEFLPGDLGNYQGHVVAVDLDHGTWAVYNALCSNVFSLLPPGVWCPFQAGIWSRPGVVYSPDTDRIYFSTGNGDFNPPVNSWGDSVLALHPNGTGRGDGAPVDSYTPGEQAQLQQYDVDLGSTAPIQLAPPAGSRFRHIAVQGGKDNALRLLNLDDLSGRADPGFLGGELSISWALPAGDEVLTSPATWIDPATGESWFFVSEGSGTYGFKVVADANGVPQAQLMWHQAIGFVSPVVVNGMVLVADGNQIALLATTTGGVAWLDGSIAGLDVHWNSPIAACGKIVFAASDRLRVWSTAGASCNSDPSPVDPVGGLEIADSPLPERLHVHGWVFDPDSPWSPVGANVSVDGVGVLSLVADGPRPDVGIAYPAAGAAHGFDATFPVAGGVHEVCVTGVNIGLGANSVLGCRSVVVARATPIGTLDAASVPAPGQVRVAGWAVDPHTTGPVEVAVRADGAEVGRFRAKEERSDVAAALPGFGSGHGFDVVVPVAEGTHQVCVDAIPVSGTDPTPLGCSVVDGDSFGALESVAVTPQRTTVTGWAIDHDVPGPTSIAVYVDGVTSGPRLADVPRRDLASVFPDHGAEVGYDVVLDPLPSGTHTLCVHALDNGHLTTDAPLGCRTLAVP